MNENAQWRFARNEKRAKNDVLGVSEVVGTILLVAISVVMVSIIGLYLVNLPPQAPSNRTNLVATFDPDTNNITLEHKGGANLRFDYVSISLMNSAGVKVSDPGISDGDFIGDANEIWEAGEKWNYHLDGTYGNTLTVSVVDLQSDLQVLSQTINLAAVVGIVPDIEIRGNGIQFNATEPDERSTIPVYLRFYNVGDITIEDDLVIRVMDNFAAKTKVVGTFTYTRDLQPQASGSLEITWTPGNLFSPSVGQHEIEVEISPLAGEINVGNNRASAEIFIRQYITEVTVVEPDLAISASGIEVTPPYPTNGDDVSISAYVLNYGDTAATVDIEFYDGELVLDEDGNVVDSGTLIGRDKDVYIRSSRTSSVSWTTSSGGLHTVSVGVVNVRSEEPSLPETNFGNNNASIPLYIKPTILLVGDDNSTSQGTLADAVARLRDSISAVGFTYDYYYVTPGGSGPKYDTGLNQLSSYDIVVWSCGFDSGSTLRSDDISNLETYLDNGGHLWLIGTDLLDDLTDGSPAGGQAFVRDYLAVEPSSITKDVGINAVNGTYNDILNLSGSTNYQTRLSVPSPYNSQADMFDVYSGFSGNASGLLYDAINDYRNISSAVVDQATGSKVAFFSWEFGLLQKHSSRAMLAYEVLRWLGAELGSGIRDLAVSDMEFSIDTPKYMQVVNISAVVQNNGEAEETNVVVGFYVDNELISSYPDQKDSLQTGIYINGSGGTVIVYKEWLATSIGAHTIKVQVDPFNYIDEISEINNDITYSTLINSQLTTTYNILVVDDDNRTGGSRNSTVNVTAALDELGYGYDVATVSSGQDGPSLNDNGTVYGTVMLKNYNTIIWNTGGETTTTLTANDTEDLMDYLDGNYLEAQEFPEDIRGTLFLMGSGLLNDLTNASYPGQGINFIQNYLHLDPGQIALDVGTPSMLYGVEDDDITHGMEYPTMDEYEDGGDAVRPVGGSGCQGVFKSLSGYFGDDGRWVDYTTTRYNATRYHENQYDVVFLPFDMSFLGGSGGGGGTRGAESRASGTEPEPETLGSGNTRSNRGTRSRAVIFNDDFDDGNLNGWSVNPSGEVEARNYDDHSPSYCAWFNDDSSDSSEFNYISTTVDMTGLTYAHLSFWLRSDNDMEDGSDYFEAYVHDGTGWDSIGTYSVDAYSSWGLAEVDISGYNMVAGFQIGFGGYKTAGNEHWRLDDVEILGSSGTTTSIFQETFSGTVDNNWRGDDNGETSPSDEYWAVDFVGGDQSDIQVDNFEGHANCLMFTDCDSGWGGQYAEARYNGGNNWFDPSSFDYAYITFYARGDGHEDGEGWRFEVTTNGGSNWETGMEEIKGTTDCDHGWREYTYFLTSSDLSSNQFGFRFNVNSDYDNEHIHFDDINFRCIVPGPTVDSTTPANGATDVSNDQDVVVVFDSSMDTGVTPDLSQTGGADPGGWSFDGWSTTNVADDTATWSHNNWGQGLSVTMEVDNFEDDTGDTGGPYSWSFTTYVSSYPTVTSTDPVDTATDIAIDYSIVITFSEDMDTTSVENAFSSSPDPGGWSFSWNGNDELTASHNDFSAHTTYTITLDASVARDAEGEFLDGDGDGTPGDDYSFSFTTLNNPPDAPTNPTPGDGATEVSTSPNLVVSLSDPDGDSMDVTFHDASDDSVIDTDSGVSSGGTASVTWSGLVASTTYSWYAVATDTQGESTQSATWSFTTADYTGPYLANGYVDPLSGDTSTLFTYHVTYYSQDASPDPTEAKVYIDGDPAGEDLSEADPGDSDFSDGKEYVYQTTLPIGSAHVFNFKFTVPGDTLWLPVIAGSTFSGPIVNSAEYQSIHGREMETELVYMTMRWFGMPDNRPELKTSRIDITLSDPHPMLGDAYVLKTTIFNYGDSDATSTVRILDGDTIIDTQTVYVGAGGSSPVETIWTPLFAGNRPVTFSIDPLNEIGEVFDVLNNNGTRLDPIVYFFYDDMESGPGNWDHDATVARINGEGKLNYMEEPTYSNINDSWEDMQGFQMNTNTTNPVINNQYHSAPRSYFMHEQEAAMEAPRPPIDVVFALDTSGSMSNTDIANLKQATKDFIAQLTDKDRAAIYTFNGDGWEDARPWLRESYAYMTSANKTSFYATIDAGNFDTGGHTCFYDTVGEAVQYTVDNVLDPDPDPDLLSQSRYEFVIGMTDGESNSDDYYTPETTWGSTTSSDPQNYNQDGWQDPLNGLLNAPCMIYTIGLGISHDSSYPTAPDWQHSPPHDGDPAVEYDIWHVADTSPDPLNDAGGKYGENETTGEDNRGHYYYTTNSDQLPGIFDSIFTAIQEVALPQAATRGSGDTRADVDNPWSDGTGTNSDKYLMTHPVDLRNVDTATLSFYQKYNMKIGANGGVILVGTSDTHGGPYTYDYVQPRQPYTGNILLSEMDNQTSGYTEAEVTGLSSVRPPWCWNGISGGGTLSWDYIEVNLEEFAGSFVKVVFYYIFTTGGTGYGWIVDDVTVRVGRDDDNPNKFGSEDNWILNQTSDPAFARSGSHAWWCGDENNFLNDTKDGVDNSLYTRPIDLTNARTATLKAFFKFNIQYDAGRPPDGFRVEVSTDNKVTWVPLNLGVRAAWNVSGNESDMSDGAMDGKSYTGLDAGNGWVRANTLTRLETSLTGFTGNVIVLRFRVVTNTDGRHYQDASKWGGFYVDDVAVYGQSLESSRRNVEPDDTAEKESAPEPKQRDLDEGIKGEPESLSDNSDEKVELTRKKPGASPYLFMLAPLMIAMILISVERRRR